MQRSDAQPIIKDGTRLEQQAFECRKIGVYALVPQCQSWNATDNLTLDFHHGTDHILSRAECSTHYHLACEQHACF